MELGDGVYDMMLSEEFGHRLYAESDLGYSKMQKLDPWGGVCKSRELGKCAYNASGTDQGEGMSWMFLYERQHGHISKTWLLG